MRASESARYRALLAALFAVALIPGGASIASAATSVPTLSPTLSPSVAPSAVPSVAPSVGQTPAPKVEHSEAAKPTPANGTSNAPVAGANSPVKKHKLSDTQKSALLAAQNTYKASVQSSLDGANKAIADARSIRDQALAASPQDKNVRALANSDFKSSSTQIWAAFRASVAQAKSTYDAAIAAIKAGN